MSSCYFDNTPIANFMPGFFIQLIQYDKEFGETYPRISVGKSRQLFHQQPKRLINAGFCRLSLSDKLKVGTKHRWCQIVFLQQAIKLGAIPLGEARGIGDVAISQLQ